MDADTLRRAYDRSADTYDERFIALQRVKYDAMLAGERVGGRVLDAGAGTGLLGAWLGRPVVALDLSAAMLRRASGDRVQGDLLRPPFGDRAFDWVCAFTSIIGRENVAPALAALARLVASQGTLVATILTVDLGEAEPVAPGLLTVRARVGCGQDLGFVWRRVL